MTVTISARPAQVRNERSVAVPRPTPAPAAVIEDQGVWVNRAVRADVEQEPVADTRDLDSIPGYF